VSKTKTAIVLVVLALIGLFDAAYLTIKTMANEPVACAISGCEQVLTSQYSHVGSIPISVFGIAFYLGILVLSGVFLFHDFPQVGKFLKILAAIGFMVSVGLTGLQVFVIKSLCMYCLASAVISTLIFVIINLTGAKDRFAPNK
jgi:uncharacterized membrane protein